jgi:hypothetical protein
VTSDPRPSSLNRWTLALLAAGLTNAEIAAAQDSNLNTVKSRVATLTRALGARNRAHAVAVAARRGLLTDPAHALDCDLNRPRTCDCGTGQLPTEETDRDHDRARAASRYAARPGPRPTHRRL